MWSKPKGLLFCTWIRTAYSKIQVHCFLLLCPGVSPTSRSPSTATASQEKGFTKVFCFSPAVLQLITTVLRAAAPQHNFTGPSQVALWDCPSIWGQIWEVKAAIIREQPCFPCAGTALGGRGLTDTVQLEQDEMFSSSPVLPILALPVLAGGHSG